MTQTWLPYPHYRESADCLTDAHLEIQIKHVILILETIHEVDESMSPLTDEFRATHNTNLKYCLEMWGGYELQLGEYGLSMVEEAMTRSKWSEATNNLGKTAQIWYDAIQLNMEYARNDDSKFEKPDWFGDIGFHNGHKGALFRSEPESYPQFASFQHEPVIWPNG